MSFAEIKEALPSLSAGERAELSETLSALEEGVSVEQFRAMKAAVEEELNDPSEDLTADQVRDSIRSMKFGDAA
jgi:hypothetical protein